MQYQEYRKILNKKLSTVSSSPQLDADLLIMYVCRLSKAELLRDCHDELPKEVEKKIQALAARRLKGEPIAYLLGNQAFWTLDLMVTKDTLIPRPETECLVEWILHHCGKNNNALIADLGTGTGAIALAIASEKKSWIIHATDTSEEALSIAKQNTEKNSIHNVSFYAGNWCDALPEKNYDVIVSNPPYIPEKDPHLKLLQFEPKNALVSGKDGLDAIRLIVNQAQHYLKPGGYLVIEHGYDQAELVCDIFKKNNFTDVTSNRDLSDVPRFVCGAVR